MQKQVSNRLAWLLISIFLGGGALLITLSLYFYRSSIIVFLSLFLGYLFHGLTFSVLMLVLSYLGLKQKSKAHFLKENPLNVTVAIPVFNEVKVIVACIDSILKQTLKAYEIIVVNDQSTDKTLEKLISTYQLKPISPTFTAKIETTKIINVYESLLIPNLKVIDKVHRGKADALNAALNISRGDIFLTIDADSFLHHNAIERLVSAISRDNLVVGAGGTVKAGNGVSDDILASDKGHLPKGFLPTIQWIEYATGFVWRFGWGFINTLLLISGSFAAFRTDVLRKCQGFDPDSITEDYEMVYRIHQYHLSNNLSYKLVTVPDALVYTLVPTTTLGLIKQRIRWFQGFLQTLFRYRSLVFSPSYGVLGIFALPIKCIDALSPLWSILTYIILAHQLIYQTLPISFKLLIGVISFRWIIDILMVWILLTLHNKFMIAPLPLKQRIYLCLISPAYLIANQLLWYIYAIAAYYRSIKGVKRWDKLERRGFQQLQQAEDLSLP